MLPACALATCSPANGVPWIELRASHARALGDVLLPARLGRHHSVHQHVYADRMGNRRRVLYSLSRPSSRRSFRRRSVE